MDLKCVICHCSMCEEAQPPAAKRAKLSSAEQSSPNEETTVELCCTPCGHLFHDACIRHWFEIGSTCPYCRKPVGAQELKPVFLPKLFNESARVVEIETSASEEVEAEKARTRNAEKAKKKLEETILEERRQWEQEKRRLENEKKQLEEQHKQTVKKMAELQLEVLREKADAREATGKLEDFQICHNTLIDDLDQMTVKRSEDQTRIKDLGGQVNEMRHQAEGCATASNMLKQAQEQHEDLSLEVKRLKEDNSDKQEQLNLLKTVVAAFCRLLAPPTLEATNDDRNR